MQHPYIDRYRGVWEQTMANGELPLPEIEKSRYYFEPDFTHPVPKTFETPTYGIAGLLPMPVEAQQIFDGLWQKMMDLLGHPIAYGVEPQNRHVEFIVFSRPEEVFPEAVARQNLEAAYASISARPPEPFKVRYLHPFITPDGTIVVPGLPEPSTVIDDFRQQVRDATNNQVPQKQSQWFHTPIGRILEPIDREKLAPVIKEIEAHWGEPVTTLDIDTLYWTSELQWYMVQKEVLHTLKLES